MGLWCRVDLVEELCRYREAGAGALHGEEEIVVVVRSEDRLGFVIVLRVADDPPGGEVHDRPVGRDGSHLEDVLSPDK